MKKLLQLTALATLIAPALVACGAAPTFNAASAPHLRPAQQMQQLRAPQQAPRFSRQNGSEINAQYWLGQIDSSEYRPDQNGMQFGFDYVTINYQDYTGQGSNSLTIMYSVHQPGGYVRIDLTTGIGTPEEQRQNLDQNDSQKLKEFNFFLSTLMTRNAQDKDNLQRILNKFAELLGEQPLVPVPLSGSPAGSQLQAQARRR